MIPECTLNIVVLGSVP